MLNKDEIIRMAREAGFARYMTDGEINWKMFERFAALVAAHERNRHAWTQEHWTEYEHAIAAAEREACAKVCDEFVEDMDFDCDMTLNQVGDLMAKYCAAAIRARGE